MLRFLTAERLRSLGCFSLAQPAGVRMMGRSTSQPFLWLAGFQAGHDFRAGGKSAQEMTPFRTA